MKSLTAVRPRKDYGQHWLRDEWWLSHIAQAACVADQAVVEIGPGMGALTEVLLREKPRRLVAIDVDPRCLKSLERLKPSHPELELYLGDALTMDLPTMMGELYRLVANLPYHIGASLVMRWMQDWAALESMVVMLQKEVIDRLAAAPGSSDYGRLSVMVQRLCTVDSLGVVPPSAFYPPPKVDSAVVVIRKRLDPLPCDVLQLDRLLQSAFGQRRKMLRRTLGVLHPEALGWLEAVGISPSDRPDSVSCEQWVALANHWPTRKK